MSDWLDHNPPALGLDPTPLYVVPVLEEPDRSRSIYLALAAWWRTPTPVSVIDPKGGVELDWPAPDPAHRWGTCDTCGAQDGRHTAEPHPSPTPPWVEEDAELALHFPWCDKSTTGTCTGQCRVVLGHDGCCEVDRA